MIPTKTLDKDLKKIARVEKARRQVGETSLNLGAALLFLLVVSVYVMLETGGVAGQMFVVAAGVVGAYMALNIGANDVANNVGPAVGSGALTMVAALVIASVFEAGGAILAGGDVVTTISKKIIDPAAMPDAATFTWAMLAALFSAAVWLNVATYVGAPVSTTHSIVGGVLGAGIAAAGTSGVDWVVMATIAASWVISPALGALIASLFLACVKFLIVFKDDKITASKRWVPVLVAVMACAFSVYIVMKGLKHVWQPGGWVVALIGLAALAFGYWAVKPLVARTAARLENTRRSVSTLFTIPLICSAALLSFAHGANDVANAVGPLAAIVSALSSGGIAAKVSVPIWVMVIGALGIAAGLMLFGPKLVRIVGERITKLDRMRAFCVALSAAITVIVASALGLPVSSTHIALGAVFGVGFLREFLVNRQRFAPAPATDPLSVRTMLAGSEPDGAAGAPPSGAAGADAVDGAGELSKKELKALKKARKKARKRRLVRRRHLFTIVAAWLITVPAAALIGALVFYTLRGMLLP